MGSMSLQEAPPVCRSRSRIIPCPEVRSFSARLMGMNLALCLAMLLSFLCSNISSSFALPLLIPPCLLSSSLSVESESLLTMRRRLQCTQFIVTFHELSNLLLLLCILFSYLLSILFCLSNACSLLSVSLLASLSRSLTPDWLKLQTLL